MSSDDDFGGLLDRETVLAGGIPARRANTVLFLIESRAAHLTAQARQAMDKFLTPEAAEDRDLAFLEAFALGDAPPRRPSIRDLERHAPGWASLVPRNPRLQAAIAHRLGEKYPFSRATIPGIRSALGLDEAGVQQAYERLYGQPIEHIYTARMTPRERVGWTWAALARWLEDLPPFWTVYALTLTETIGVTILALPIAVAEIGPLPGVAIMAVLGLMNVLTIVYLTEAVARGGAMRYGSGYIGKLVDDFLGRVGSLVLSVGVFVLCFIVLQVFYIGFSSALEGTTHVPAAVWVAVLFLVGLFFLRRESLSATVASALVVGAVNVVLVLALALVAFTHAQSDNLLHVAVPFVGGRPFEPEIVGLVFGVILSAYFGHLSVGTCARVVLKRDPSARSLIWGAAAAQVTAVLLYCVFVLAVNSAIAPQVLAEQAGTALDPLAAQIGPGIYVLGAVFVVLGMGMGSVQYTLVLFNTVRERLPTPSRPVVVLGRREGVLLLHERGHRGAGSGGLRMGLVYLGLSRGQPQFRLDVELDGEAGRIEKRPAGDWEVLGAKGDAGLLERIPALRNRDVSLSLAVLEADPQSARVQVTSSLRPAYERTRDEGGVDLAGVLTLPERQAEIVGWMAREGEIGLAEASAHLGEDEDAARTLLRELERGGFVAERSGTGAEPRYAARLAQRRRGSAQAWGALREGEATPAGAEAPRLTRASGLARLVSSSRGSFAVSVSPVAVAFLIAEWLVLTGSGSFTGLVGLIGVLIVPLLGGIFPVLLLVAGRRKGERLPAAASRLLGEPVLLAGIYVLFLAGIFLHALVIWTDPVKRILALVVGLLVIGLTFAMRAAFAERLVVELREEDERAVYAMSAAGRPDAADVLLAYPNGEQRQTEAAAEISRFSSLRQVSFHAHGDAPAAELKVWAHRVTQEGDSEGLAGLLEVRQDGETKRFDLKLSRGRVVVPVASGDCRVQITLG